MEYPMVMRLFQHVPGVSSSQAFSTGEHWRKRKAAQSHMMMLRLTTMKMIKKRCQGFTIRRSRVKAKDVLLVETAMIPKNLPTYRSFSPMGRIAGSICDRC